MGSVQVRPRGPKVVSPRVVGRYLMYDEIASGGMAAVHFGRLSSAGGFSRTVAIKHLHPQFARDTDFVSMFFDEARLASRIRHPNVAAPLDVVVLGETQEVFLIMEYIHGETLARLLQGAIYLQLPLPPNISAGILCGALHGLHAAHEAADEQGVPLYIVHRDISPQNIMVGSDGVPRVLDFGIAKAASRAQSTRAGEIKGKFSYMAPEQLNDRPVDRRADIFAAGIVLWEALTLRRLFYANDPVSAAANVLHAVVPRPSTINGNVSQALDRVVLKALNRNAAARFQTAREFAAALEEEAFIASTRKVAGWVANAAAQSLAERTERLAAIEGERLEASQLAGSGQPAQSLRTISQTVAILREADLCGATVVNTPNPEREDAATTEPGATGPAWQAATELGGTRALSPAAAPTEDKAGWTVTALVQPWRRNPWLVIGLLGAVVLALTSVGVGLHAAALNPARPPAPPATVRPTPAPGLEGATEPPPSAPPPSKPIAAGIGAAAERFAAPIASPKPKVERASKRGRPAKSCDPPFFVDPQGIRRIKTQCL